MIYVRTLGTAQIDAGELRITPASARKFGLLLRLAAEAGRPVSRATIHELVYSDLPERNARHSLRDVLYQFRQAGVAIACEGEDIRIDPSEVRFDYDEVLEGSISIERLKTVQGGLLPGYAPEESEAFADWLGAYRAATTLCICRALSKEINRAKSVGDWLATEQAARACLALEPTHEEATLALAETLAASGSKAQAVNLLDQYVRDLGPSRSQLQVSATVLRRRISERVPDVYRSGLTLPFLGRDAEMATLAEHFELARSGESHCVAIVGDAGIGKTRLAEEFCTQAALKGARVERLVTQPHDAHRPMATFADLVPRLLKLPGALGCSPESIAALKRLTTPDSEASTPANDLPSEAVASGISRAIADLVDSIASEGTLVLVVDDIQWSDDLSRRAIATLVSAKQSRRLLVILTSRDRGIVQYFARRAERLRSIALSPLTANSVSAILGRLLDGNELAADEELSQWLAQSSGGNPFFLRCLVSHIQSTGERFVVPSTISSLLDQQLATLGPEALSVLSICVTLGRHSSIDHVVEALGITHLQLQTALRELESSHLITQSGPRIEPAHWLIAESVMRTTPPIALKVLHRQVATVLEHDREGLDGASRLWDCAEHWILADEQTRAAKAIHACADYSVEIGRPREAAESLLRAAPKVAKDQAIQLAVRALQLSDAAGEADLVLRAGEQVRNLGASLEDPPLQLAEALAMIGGREETQYNVECLYGWLTPDKPLELRVRAALAIVVHADLNGRPEVATIAFNSFAGELTLEAAADDLPTLAFLLVYHSLFGAIDTSLRVAERILRLATDLDIAHAANLQRKCGIALFRAGRAAEGIRLLATAYRNASSRGLTRLQCHSATMLAGFCADIGDDDAAADWREKMDAGAVQLVDHWGSLLDVSISSELELYKGNVAGAKAAFARLRTPRTPTNKVMRWQRALEARIAQLDNQARDGRRTASEMVDHHRANNESNDIGDLETAVAIHALANEGLEEQARTLLTRYVSFHRRVRAPFTRALQEAIKLLDSPDQHPSFAQSFDFADFSKGELTGHVGTESELDMK